jgi:hypothetical protein
MITGSYVRDAERGPRVAGVTASTAAWFSKLLQQSGLLWSKGKATPLFYSATLWSSGMSDKTRSQKRKASQDDESRQRCPSEVASTPTWVTFRDDFHWTKDTLQLLLTTECHCWCHCNRLKVLLHFCNFLTLSSLEPASAGSNVPQLVDQTSN